MPSRWTSTRRSAGRCAPRAQWTPSTACARQRLIGVGDSQSAFELTTYLDAIQPTVEVYDGFFLHSRGGGAISLEGGNIATGILGAIRIRDDFNVPVLLFETETDEALLRYFDARQPDTAHIPVAGRRRRGTRRHLSGRRRCLAARLQRPDQRGPHSLRRRRRLASARSVVANRSPPAVVERMDVALQNGAPTVLRDHLGNAISGLRTPALDVPVAALSGVPSDPSTVLCLLFGSTHPFDAATLARLYPSQAAYNAAYTQATDAAIAAGHLLPADRAQLLADAAKLPL